MGKFVARTGWGLLVLNLPLVVALYGQQASPDLNWDNLAVPFEAGRGQVEAGGPYAGVEFHHSRPLPSRISFYYPVANSIDLGTDYWQRDQSQPFTMSVAIDGQDFPIGTQAFGYRWTPYRVDFHGTLPTGPVTVSYRFAENLPFFVWHFRLTNHTSRPTEVEIKTNLAASVRTSHTYSLRDPARVHYARKGSDFLAVFDEEDTGNAEIFVLNAGTAPSSHGLEKVDRPEARFVYLKTLEPGETIEIIQLIGSVRREEAENVRTRIREMWRYEIEGYEQAVERTVARDLLSLPDSGLIRTAHLARALLHANRHYIDGRIVPMPCPAEYNFFFTHDLLLTDLGAVLFDTGRVRHDLLFIRSLAGPDTVLPHAYYWKDGAYITEPAESDNWNHLWFIILTASYLKHSGNTGLVTDLFPLLEKSMSLMLLNEHDGLMWEIRPDWWDIGNVYGPRAYLTILTIRALEAFSYIQTRLDRNVQWVSGYLTLAGKLRRQLVETLWDNRAGYLLNRLDAARMDHHLYAGSLLAPAFGLLDATRANRLLDTAEKELLDPKLGIRNVMPADFHTLIDVYHFNGMEAGGPYLYLNGGIWPQGSAWYALALLETGRSNQARRVLQQYLSLDGIMSSPNGQPAFFEYRNGNPDSPEYGQIDKPAFLWAGGWYLYVLYRLAGVRENAWNLSFDPRMPEDFDHVIFDLAVEGRRVGVSCSGSGPYFKSIRFDGVSVPSAVILKPADEIILERGLPDAPYLASATAIVDSVSYLPGTKTLSLILTGAPNQETSIKLVSPSLISRIEGTAFRIDNREESTDNYGVTSSLLTVTLNAARVHVDITFD